VGVAPGIYRLLTAHASLLIREAIFVNSSVNPTQDDSFGFAAKFAGSLPIGEGLLLMVWPTPTLRAALPAPCGFVIRNGKDCGRALPLPAPRLVTDFASKEPPH